MSLRSKIIYHGSYMKIEFPEIRKHRFTKDFSWGFYCTEIKEQAEKWASKFNTSMINVYELREIEALNIKGLYLCEKLCSKLELIISID